MARTVAAALTCAGLFFVAIGLGIASAQGAPADEHRWVPQAAMANMAEIQFGHLAVKKAQDPRVKKFGQMMVDEHVKAQKALADAASGVGIQWPKQLDASHKQTHERLSRLSNEQFDREYMKTMIDGHRGVEKMLAARAGEDGGKAQKSDDSALAAQVNQWAVKTLPTVRTHLREAEQMYGELGK
jgi:putative membrane protein